MDRSLPLELGDTDASSLLSNWKLSNPDDRIESAQLAQDNPISSLLLTVSDCEKKLMMKSRHSTKPFTTADLFSNEESNSSFANGTGHYAVFGNRTNDLSSSLLTVYR